MNSKIILLVFFWLSANNPSILKSNNDPSSNKTTSYIKDVKSKTEYAEIASYYLNFHNDEKKFDSLSRIAIAQAESTFNTELILQLSLRYLEDMPLKNNYKFSTSIIKRVESLSNDLDEHVQHDIWLILSEAYLKIHDYQHGNKYAVKALGVSLVENNRAFYIKALMSVAKSLEFNRNYIEAFQNFMTALYQVELLDNKTEKEKFRNDCYESLFQFNNKVKKYDEAAIYKNLLIDKLVDNRPVDSTKLYWHYYDLVGLSIRSKRYGFVDKTLDNILNFASRSNNRKMKDFTLSLYRSLLIESNNLSGFQDLYYDRYPNDLINIRKENTFLYYRILAYIQESKSEIDSAKNYFEIAKTHLSTIKNPITKSNFHIRYGEFLLRFGDVSSALLNYKKAFQFAKERNYVPYLLTTSHQLDTLCYQLKDYENAYYYKNLYVQFSKDQSSKTKQDELLKIELNNESKQIELLKLRKEEDTKKKHNLQYLTITIGISILFLFIILLGQISISEWIVRALGFLGVLMLFEFIILLMDNELHKYTHGAPLYIFIIKILILLVLFPLHHIFEKKLVNHLISNKRIRKPNKKAIINVIKHLWPWVE